MGERIRRAECGVMVARYIEQGNVQHANDVFEVGVGQVAAPCDEFHLLELTARAQVIQTFDHFIADGEDFHKRYCAAEWASLQGKMTIYEFESIRVWVVVKRSVANYNLPT